MTDKTDATDAPAPRRTTLLALIVGAAFFMELLDGAIIAPAVPEIAKSFGTNAVAVSAGISSYLITVAIFIPASAWLSDRLGARNVFAAAIALFTIASVMCGLSETLTQFTLARIVQGVAGAMMSPVGRIAVLRRTEKSEMLRIIAYLSWPGLTAFIVGPPLGGFLTTLLSWRWIFFINIPIGIVGIVLVLIFFEKARAEVKRRFDALGFGLTGGALACLMYGIEGISRSGNTLIAGGFMLAGALLGAAALRHLRRNPSPLLSLTPFQVPSFRTGTLFGGAPFRLAAGAAGFLLPVMFQVAFGMSALDAGLLFGYFLAGDLVIKAVANRVVRRFGFRATLIGTSVLVAGSFAAFMVIEPRTPMWVLIILLFGSGAVRSIQFTALNSLVFGDMPQDQIGYASTLQSMLQQINFGIGVGLAAIVLALSSQWQGHASDALTLADFRAGFAFCLVLIVVSAIVYVRMPAHTGAHMR